MTELNMTDTENNPKRNRRVIVTVPYEKVLCLLMRSVQTLEYLETAQPIGIPNDAHVVSVHDDYPRASFAFILEHERFDPVQTGQRYPEVFVKWSVVRLAKAAQHVTTP